MNLFRHELRTYRKTTLIWTTSLCALAIVFLVLMYPAFTNDVAASRNVIARLPSAVRDAFGISLESFFTIFGMYSYVLAFITLAGAVQAMNLGVGIVSKEESGKTADFLLSKPISRTKVLTSKLLAAACLIAFTNIVLISVSFISAELISKEAFSASTFLRLSLTVIFVQFAFLAIGILCSVVIPRIKSVTAVTLPVVFSMYIIGTLGAIIGNQNVKYVTPFKFFDSSYTITHGRYERSTAILELVLIILIIKVSYLIYLKKDMRAAS